MATTTRKRAVREIYIYGVLKGKFTSRRFAIRKASEIAGFLEDLFRQT